MDSTAFILILICLRFLVAKLKVLLKRREEVLCNRLTSINKLNDIYFNINLPHIILRC